MLAGLSQYLPESTLTLFDNLEFFVRLLLSAALGALVGLERSKRQKEPMVLSSTFLKKQRFSASPIVFPRLSCLLRDVLRYSMPGGVGRWRASWEKPCAKWRSETKMRVLV